MPRKKLLVCDLDNTLYDWVSYFVPSFYAMVDVVVQITGCEKEKLLDDFRAVHQLAHDSEQPFALLETDTIKKIYNGVPPDAVMRELDPAFHAFNSTRKRKLELYPGVRDTLEHLASSGVVLVAHTESKLYGVVDRLRRLDLYKYFSRIYCRERSTSFHSIPDFEGNWFQGFPIDRVTELSQHQAKPNPSVLLEICADEDISYSDTAYVGDSIVRDVLMAKRAQVFAIWAEYGARYDSQLYADLVRISHWTPEEVVREEDLRKEAKAVQPDYVARNSFSEIAAVII